MMGRAFIRGVAFDMEGCLTADPTVWEIMHRKLGTWESHGLPYWRRYCAGELDYDDFARMDVAVWRGAAESLLLSAAREVPLMQGCAELLAALRRAGIRMAVITNGLSCVADRFRLDHGVESIFANRAVVRDGILTGELDIRVPYRGKGDALGSLAEQWGLPLDEIAAVGDSPADVGMFCRAGLAIAFRPVCPEVAEAATHVVCEADLRAVLSLLVGG